MDPDPADPSFEQNPSPQAPTKDPSRVDPAGRPESLPPVQPPTAGFLLQLFLIPMVIVTIIVLVWFSFSWLAHQGVDPHDLARSLRTRNDASWQKAYNLSNMLRNPKNAELKRDKLLAQELSDVLELELRVRKSDTDSMAANVSKREYETEARVRLRVYLCKALGEFELPDVAAVLVKAARQELSATDIPVRQNALEALAVLASQVDLQSNADVMEALFEASRDRASNAEKTERFQRNKLRATAAFALGMFGSEEALNQLESMLSDPYTNVRLNAATALARHGDPRCIETLVMMLDPENTDIVADEETDEGQRFKRAELLGNGIRAIRKFIRENSTTDLAPLVNALQKLADDTSMSRDVTLAAKETLALIRARSES